MPMTPCRCRGGSPRAALHTAMPRSARRGSSAPHTVTRAAPLRRLLLVAVAAALWQSDSSSQSAVSESAAQGNRASERHGGSAAVHERASPLPVLFVAAQGDGDAGTYNGECDPSCGDSCSGPSSIECLSCPGTLVLDNGRCVGICPADKYPSLETGQCERCDLRCVSCEGPSQHECTACTNQEFLMDGVCSVCHPQCSGCDGPTQNDCSACNSGRYRDGGTCYAECPDGKWQDERRGIFDYTCEPCDAACATCFGSLPIECRSCNPGWFLDFITCHEKCPDGLMSDRNTHRCRAHTDEEIENGRAIVVVTLRLEMPMQLFVDDLTSSVPDTDPEAALGVRGTNFRGEVGDPADVDWIRIRSTLTRELAQPLLTDASRFVVRSLVGDLQPQEEDAALALAEAEQARLRQEAQRAGATAGEVNAITVPPTNYAAATAIELNVVQSRLPDADRSPPLLFAEMLATLEKMHASGALLARRPNASITEIGDGHPRTFLPYIDATDPRLRQSVLLLDCFDGIHRTLCPWNDVVLVALSYSIIALVIGTMAYLYRTSRRDFRKPDLHACFVIVVETINNSTDAACNIAYMVRGHTTVFIISASFLAIAFLGNSRLMYVYNRYRLNRGAGAMYDEHYHAWTNKNPGTFGSIMTMCVFGTHYMRLVDVKLLPSLDAKFSRDRKKVNEDLKEIFLWSSVVRDWLQMFCQIVVIILHHDTIPRAGTTTYVSFALSVISVADAMWGGRKYLIEDPALSFNNAMDVTWCRRFVRRKGTDYPEDSHSAYGHKHFLAIGAKHYLYSRKGQEEARAKAEADAKLAIEQQARRERYSCAGFLRMLRPGAAAKVAADKAAPGAAGTSPAKAALKRHGSSNASAGKAGETGEPGGDYADTGAVRKHRSGSGSASGSASDGDEEAAMFGDPAQMGGRVHKNRLWPPLDTAVHDAESMARRFAALGYGTKVMMNAEFTYENLEKHFTETLKNELDRGDLVVVYFAGHAFTDVKLGGKRTEGFLVPWEGKRPIDKHKLRIARQAAKERRAQRKKQKKKDAARKRRAARKKRDRERDRRKRRESKIGDDGGEGDAAASGGHATERSGKSGRASSLSNATGPSPSPSPTGDTPSPSPDAAGLPEASPVAVGRGGDKSRRSSIVKPTPKKTKKGSASDDGGDGDPGGSGGDGDGDGDGDGGGRRSVSPGVPVSGAGTKDTEDSTPGGGGRRRSGAESRLTTMTAATTATSNTAGTGDTGDASSDEASVVTEDDDSDDNGDDAAAWFRQGASLLEALQEADDRKTRATTNTDDSLETLISFATLRTLCASIPAANVVILLDCSLSDPVFNLEDMNVWGHDDYADREWVVIARGNHLDKDDDAEEDGTPPHGAAAAAAGDDGDDAGGGFASGGTPREKRTQSVLVDFLLNYLPGSFHELEISTSHDLFAALQDNYNEIFMPWHAQRGSLNSHRDGTVYMHLPKPPKKRPRTGGLADRLKTAKLGAQTPKSGRSGGVTPGGGITPVGGEDGFLSP